MANVCAITGKCPRSGQKRSHSLRATKRWFKPNVLKKYVEVNGVVMRLKIAAKTYKRLQKDGEILMKFDNGEKYRIKLAAK